MSRQFPLATTIPSCHLQIEQVSFRRTKAWGPRVLITTISTGHVHSTAIPSRASGQPCSLRRCPLRKLIGLYPSWRSHWRPRRRQVCASTLSRTSWPADIEQWKDRYDETMSARNSRHRQAGDIDDGGAVLAVGTKTRHAHLRSVIIQQWFTIRFSSTKNLSTADGNPNPPNPFARFERVRFVEYL